MSFKQRAGLVEHGQRLLLGFLNVAWCNFHHVYLAYCLRLPASGCFFLFFAGAGGIRSGLMSSAIGSPSAFSNRRPKMAAAVGPMSIIRASTIFAPSRAPAP